MPDIALTPLQDADLPLLYRWINDRETAIHNNRYAPVPLANHREWYDAVRCRADVAIFAIRDIGSAELLGTCQLVDIDPVSRTAELRIRIGAEARRGRGVGTRAVQLLVRHAFDDLNLQRVHLRVHAHNARAIRCYEKAGFAHEGVQRRADYVDGQYVDIVLMATLRPLASSPPASARTTLEASLW